MMESSFDVPLTDALLHGFAIQTISPHGALSISWAFPALPEPLSSVLLARSNFTESIVSRFNNIWHYSSPCVRSSPPSERAVSAVVVWGARFAPEAGTKLASVLAEAFSAGGTSRATDIWLEVLSTGSSVTPAWAPVPPARALFAPNGARALLSALGLESILIWTALMARRRVAVLGTSAAETARAARVLSLMVAHRAEVNGVAAGGGGGFGARTRGTSAALLVPYVALSDYAFAGGAQINALAFDGALGVNMRNTLDIGIQSQKNDLNEIGSFIAGFTDPRVSTWGGEIWDVLVDVGARSVTVAETARGELYFSLEDFKKIIKKNSNPWPPPLPLLFFFPPFTTITSLSIDR